MFEAIAIELFKVVVFGFVGAGSVLLVQHHRKLREEQAAFWAANPTDTPLERVGAHRAEPEADAAAVPPPRWPGVNPPYTAHTVTAAEDQGGEPTQDPTYRGTASTGQPFDVHVHVKNAVLHGWMRAAANDEPTQLITPVVSAKDGAQ